MSCQSCSTSKWPKLFRKFHQIKKTKITFWNSKVISRSTIAFFSNIHINPWIGHHALPPPPTYTPPPTFSSFDMSKTRNEMLLEKKGTNFIFWPLLLRYPQTCLKLGGRAAWSYVVGVVINQSAHAIYHITDNWNPVLIIHHPLQKNKYAQTCFYSKIIRMNSKTN